MIDLLVAILVGIVIYVLLASALAVTPGLALLIAVIAVFAVMWV